MMPRLQLSMHANTVKAKKAIFWPDRLFRCCHLRRWLRWPTLQNRRSDSAGFSAFADHSNHRCLLPAFSQAAAVCPVFPGHHRIAQLFLSPSCFNTESAKEDLGFYCRPIEETVAYTVAFLQKIFRIDADSILKNGKPVRSSSKKSSPLLLGLTAAGTLFLARHILKKSDR